MSLSEKIFYRAKGYVERYKKKLIAKHMKINYKEIADIPFDLLETLQTIGSYSTRYPTLIDIGAHKGFFTRAANLFFNISHSICVEPNEQLHRDIKLNNRNLNLHIEATAIALKQGETNYYLHQDSAMNSIVESNSNVLREKFPYDNPDKITFKTIPVITLDQLAEKYNVLTQDNPVLLKIDTQGNELEILMGGLKTLKNTSVCVVEQMFISAYKSYYNFKDLVNFMHNINFECKGACAFLKRQTHEISSVDFIFMKKA